MNEAGLTAYTQLIPLDQGVSPSCVNPCTCDGNGAVGGVYTGVREILPVMPSPIQLTRSRMQQEPGGCTGRYWTRADPNCRDDPDGHLASGGASCTQILPVGCTTDLHTLDSNIPEGSIVNLFCPLSCKSCTPAPGGVPLPLCLVPLACELQNYTTAIRVELDNPYWQQPITHGYRRCSSTEETSDSCDPGKDQILRTTISFMVVRFSFAVYRYIIYIIKTI
eukprot:COSAG05_NODE_314_length_11610_cov_17.223265_8_plen_222_part_00